MSWLYCSSGFRMRGNSPSVPSYSGFQPFMMMPLGTYTNAMRTGGFVVVAEASAGTIASRNGSATAVPMPRRNVRLGRDFLVIMVELAPC
jgi:hypothetical protein